MQPKPVLHIYTRVSTAEQKNKDFSLPRQRELGIECAKKHGMSYVVYEEDGASASQEDFDNRPKFTELLHEVEAGICRHLFVFDQTRLSRNTITKAVVQNRLNKAKVQLYTHSKDYDFSKSEDQMTFGILSVMEAYESALRKARFHLGYVSSNRKGKFPKGIPPYGYKKDKEGILIVDDDEKQVFLKIVDMYLKDGYGTQQIANYLNENNIPTKTEQFYKNGYTLREGVRNRKQEKHITKSIWNPGTVLTMLKNELYCGRRKFKVGNDRYDYVPCPALLDKTTFAKIQKVRKQNAITKKREDKYFYLLKNLLVCANCGSAMHGRINISSREFSYRCNTKRFGGSNCDSRCINITKLNNIVWNTFRSSLFYHKLINNHLVLQLNDKNSYEESIEDVHIEMKSIVKSEALIEKKIKHLIEKELDERVSKKIFNELMDKYHKESKLLADNRRACASNLKLLTMRKQNIGSELMQGLLLFQDAKEKVDSVYPCKNNKQELQARNYLRTAICAIKVTYIPKENKHIVEVTFERIGIKKDFNDREFDSYKSIPSEMIQVGSTDEFPVYGIQLPKISKANFLNTNKQFAEEWEKERLLHLGQSELTTKKKKKPSKDLNRYLKQGYELKVSVNAPTKEADAEIINAEVR